MLVILDNMRRKNMFSLVPSLYLSLTLSLTWDGDNGLELFPSKAVNLGHKYRPETPRVHSNSKSAKEIRERLKKGVLSDLYVAKNAGNKSCATIGRLSSADYAAALLNIFEWDVYWEFLGFRFGHCLDFWVIGRKPPAARSRKMKY